MSGLWLKCVCHGGETQLTVLAEAVYFELQQAAAVYQLVHVASTAEP